ncbi:MAG: hypothetical protein UX18_C0022G0008, partial [Candidatus Azambacteria bacterium GW2011_GWC2_45_7b]
MEALLRILGILALMGGFIVALVKDSPVALICFFLGLVGLVLIIVANKMIDLEDQNKKLS